MDPTNNPTPTPNPAPAPAPSEGMPPVNNAAPAPAPAPVQPPQPSVPTPPTPPVNPVINPANNPTPVNPVFQPTGGAGLPETEPITQPEPAPAPDPIEEELKAPMKAADPVPGSIGSAVSGPEGAGTPESIAGPTDNPFEKTGPRTPNVSFNDPATQPDASGMPQGAAPAKKKTSKTTLILLAIVAVMVVIALGAVLAMQLSGGSSSPTGGGATPTPTPTTEEKTLSCSREMTESELTEFGDVSSGEIDIKVQYSDGELSEISLEKALIILTADGEELEEPEVMEANTAKADQLVKSDAEVFFLPVDDEGELVLTRNEVKANYEELDFTCKVL